MTLEELVKREGYTLEVDPNASARQDIRGLPQEDELCAQACDGNVIAVRPGVPVPFRVYPVSHEIAEDRCGFTGHHQGVWREQLSIVCRWVRLLLDENARLRAEKGRT